jgi:hypothetical protein
MENKTEGLSEKQITFVTVWQRKDSQGESDVTINIRNLDKTMMFLIRNWTLFDDDENEVKDLLLGLDILKDNLETINEN